jgi:hypothetical protein
MVLKDDPPNMTICECIESVAKVVSLRDIEAKAKDARMQHHTDALEERVKLAVESNLKTVEQVSELLAAYRGMVNSGKIFTDSELRSSFCDARDMLSRFLAENAVKDGMGSEQLKTALELANHYINDAGLQNDNGTVAETDRLHMVAIHDVSSAILTVKDVIAVRQALPESAAVMEKDKLLKILIRKHTDCAKAVTKSQGLIGDAPEEGGRCHWLRTLCAAWGGMNDKTSFMKIVIIKDATESLHHYLKDIKEATEHLQDKYSVNGVRGKMWHDGWPKGGKKEKELEFIVKTLDTLDQTAIEARGFALEEARSSHPL